MDGTYRRPGRAVASRCPSHTIDSVPTAIRCTPRALRDIPEHTFPPMPKGFHPRRQGDLGEAAAIQWLTWIGACVSFPLFHSPDYDLIADLNGRLLRVQVKTSRCTDPSKHYAVQLATSGGNQSWTRTVKTFDPLRVDFLFVLVADGRRWFIPAAEVEGMRAVRLGGPKYSEFQIGRTAPIGQYDPARSKLDQDGRGSAGVGEPGRTVNSVATPEWVRIPPPPLTTSPSTTFESRERGSGCGRTRMSANHQLTIPRGPFESAQLEVGDRFRVEADGKGRVILTRIEEYIEQYSRQLALDSDSGPDIAEGND
jgi:hypothetical protein